MQSYAATFSLGSADTMAGVALTVTASLASGQTSNVCFDNVSLIAQ
jgi:hypothetical protein